MQEFQHRSYDLLRFCLESSPVLIPYQLQTLTTLNTMQSSHHQLHWISVFLPATLYLHLPVFLTEQSGQHRREQLAPQLNSPSFPIEFQPEVQTKHEMPSLPSQ